MSEDTLPAADAVARERIATDLDTTLFVEAGAGSGKTESLVRRIAALFAGGRAAPRNLAAVTFTRKAAAELRQRLQVRLEELARAEADPERRSRCRAASTDLGEAFVGTIHAFCGRLLREHPFEAGLDPDFAELEQDEAAVLRQAAWQDYLASLQADRPDLPETLADLDVTVADLHAIYQQLARYPEVPPVTAARPRPLPDRGALAEFVAGALRRFPRQLPAGGWDPLQRAVLRCRRLLALDEAGVGPSLFRAYEALGGNLDGRMVQRKWADGHGARDLYRAFRRETVAPLLTAWREYRHRPLLELVRPAVAFAARHRHAAARVDYQDLLLGAARLLRDHRWVRRRLASRITHLLVDEYQDTDPIQAEVMFLLTGTPEEETDWRRLRPRPGSLFVVGDPKQSIYRFRRADIAAYHEVKERIRAAGGTVLRLEANFRSLPSVARWASATFGTILPPDDSAYQAAFAPLLAARPDSEGLGAGVRRLTIPKVRGNVASDIARLDARRIAGWIAWATAGHLTLARSQAERDAGLPDTAEPGDFLILTPYHHRLGIYAAALESAGLPVDVSGSDALAASPTVVALLQVLRAVSDPEDAVAVLACLRGPLLGLSDAQLYRFRAGGGDFSLLRPAEGSEDPVEAELGRLRGYWRWARDLPPDAAVVRVVEDLGLLPLAAGGPLGGSEAGALIEVVGMFRAVVHTEACSFRGAVTAVDAALEVGGRDAPSLVPAVGKAVRLMNRHKAKGLEAPVVFLADPSRRIVHEPATHVRRAGGRLEGHFAFRRADHGGVIAQPPDWAGRAEEEARYAAAEDDRLLYVAATRARNLLVVSRYEGAPDADPWARLGPALESVPELEGVQGPSATRPVLELSRGEVAAAVDRTGGAIRAAGVPSVLRVAVTDLVEGGVPAAAGDGASWGRAVHRLLAATASGLDRARWSAAAARLLADEGRGTEEAERLSRTVSAVWDSGLGARLEGAEAVMVEVPFAQAAPAAQLGMSAEGPDQAVVEGVVDLAFREAGGWVLVDYKTDTAATTNLAELTAHYAPQLRQYADFWATALGAPVKEALLYFTAPMRAVPIAI